MLRRLFTSAIAHAVLSAASPIERIIITDSIPACDRLAPLKDRLTVLSVAPLMGEAIKRIHLNQSVSAVLKGASGGKR